VIVEPMFSVFHSFLSLMIGRDRVLEGVVNSFLRPLRRVNESDEVFFDIDGLEKKSFMGVRGRVLEQDLPGPVQPPHFKPRSEKAAIGERFMETRDGMEAVDGHDSFR